MKTSYCFKGGLASRSAQTPCHLAPPLREFRAFSYGHIVWNLPLVDQGLLFLSLRKRLRALDEKTLREVWALDRNSSPAALIDGQLVTWVDEYAHILDSKTARRRTKRKWPVAIECAIVGDLFFGQSFEEGQLLYAASLVSGKVQWSFRPGPKDGRIACVFCATEEGVFFGFENGTISALGLKTGRELWRRTLPKVQGLTNQVQRMAIAYGDTVVFMTGCSIVAVSAENGRSVWKRSIADAIVDGCLYGDRYYALTATGQFFAISAKSGRVLFETSLKKHLPPKFKMIDSFFPMLVSETHTFIGCNYGYVLCFERDTGKYVWSHRPKGWGSFHSQTYFMSANGRFYYADMSGRLYCLQEERGLRLGEEQRDLKSPVNGRRSKQKSSHSKEGGIKKRVRKRSKKK